MNYRHIRETQAELLAPRRPVAFRFGAAHLPNAAAVAGLLITTEAAISEFPEEKSGGGGMGCMGGMGGGRDF